MYVPFEQLDGKSRLWIYQSERPFTSEEVDGLLLEIQNFLEEWTSHNRALQASFQIVENRILVMGVDEGVAGASGCSIDKMMHFIQALEQRHNLSLLNRQLITYRNNGSWETTKLRNFIEGVRTGDISSSTLIYDLLISDKATWQESSTKPVLESWVKKMI